MTEFRFDPPLALKGNVVVRNLDDAVRFMIGYREARRPALQTSVYITLKEPPAKKRSAMRDTHFVAGRRGKASSSNSANKKVASSKFKNGARFRCGGQNFWSAEERPSGRPWKTLHQS
jgi:hypothetical protein